MTKTYGPPPGTAAGRSLPFLPEPGSAPTPGLGAERPTRRAVTLLRRVEVVTLSPRGGIEETSCLLPSLPAFEEPFSAFARGTIFASDRGMVSVEDVWPGMVLRIADGGTARVLWRGSTVIVPRGEGQDPAMTRLTRVAAESMGLGKPFQDLVLGPRARVVVRRPAVRLLTGRDAALVPAADLVDGVSLVEVTPPSPVEVYHLAFARHETLLANGIEVESYHPGPLHALSLRGDHLALFQSCFPQHPDLLSFGDPALPRLRRHDLDLFDAV
ncbi:Hint domain-containing protein [Rubellimicrobium rubrum]|uniref:Hint domain-containing protein n=1 Tax=Rubellimicrobium rubrum TaxID=2585369 RepID=UPI001FE6C0A2|nr:Hint domain-containing protein [Rubellimicrobium rubrum]